MPVAGLSDASAALTACCARSTHCCAEADVSFQLLPLTVEQGDLLLKRGSQQRPGLSNKVGLRGQGEDLLKLLDGSFQPALGNQPAALLQQLLAAFALRQPRAFRGR